MDAKIEKIIVKFLNESASAADLNMLSGWMKNPANLNIFREYVYTHYIINHSISCPKNDAVIDQLITTIREEKSIVRKLMITPVIKYVAAAAVVVALISAYIFTLQQPPAESIYAYPNMVKNIKPGEDKAILTLGDGSVVNLQKGESYQAENASSNGEEIVYGGGVGKNEVITQNYLTVPLGGQFSITLSDGTKVWLNSRSQLKYPTHFTKDKAREVELVYGEAYFEVTHDDSEFIVKNKTADITVLGTKFNVSSYDDDHYFSSTLVEGSVKLSAKSTESQSVLLSPGERGVISGTDVEVSQVDTSIYTSWVDGKFYFEKQPLESILTKMSRWYSIQVSFENEELKHKTFTGVTSKQMPIEHLLNLISKTTNVDYKILKKKEGEQFELVIVNK